MVDFNSDYQMLIDGQLASAPATFQAFNPATKAPIAAVPEATKAQLDAAVEAARAAFVTWRHSTREQRQEVLGRMAGVLECNAEEFMALLTKEQGKPRAGAEWEIRGSAIWCRELAKLALLDEVVQDSKERRVYTRYAPLGVIGAITPWNFPILLAIWKIAPALMTGNCIIVKPSPFTPLSTLKLGELCKD